ncbi:ammonium transporter [Sphingomonas sp. CGMCC 1.13654]|uniref:Ammonium transporter n=1 Tax=Sphingomonas chungangi TaxID=2683589 RepID=A0A838L2T1_9SPHN|nr:ammonium transporter [Sphingomonas chungangi]MBA2932536.1 ammonium transporter [Sphingomonas chungangi]MVW56159.1 ammonium transporter [Sphingomonas chungangi]
MKLSTKILAGLGAVGAAALLTHPAFAQAAAAAAPAPAPTIATASLTNMNKGDNTWMLVSTLLVLMMSIPGLALFYGGLVRTKNMLSVLTQVLMIVCMVGVIWVCWGYSETFTSFSPFVGNPFTKLFLKGVDSNAAAATFSNGVYIPELTYVLFQMTFAMITPALFIGSVAERIKFSPLMLFVALWVTFVYFPIAHMVWCWDGPDAFAAAALKGQAAIDAVSADSGYLFNKGALDFAGGTVVHINAGITGLVMCLMLGKRLGYPNEPMPPHSLTMTMIGASLLWVGWFGFNAGSNLEASSIASVAFMNTMIATAAAGLSWLLVEQAVKGKPSLLGAASGVVAGLVAVTPASGYAGTMGSVILGLMVSPICFFFVTVVKSKFGYDDSLDVFGVHCIGGITGAIMTGILDAPSFGGQGIADYTTKPGTMVAGTYDMVSQVITQIEAVAITLVWSGVGAAILFFVIDKVWGFRVTPEVEHEGLDIAEHGERAYHY